MGEQCSCDDCASGYFTRFERLRMWFSYAILGKKLQNKILIVQMMRSALER